MALSTVNTGMSGDSDSKSLASSGLDVKSSSEVEMAGLGRRGGVGREGGEAGVVTSEAIQSSSVAVFVVLVLDFRVRKDGVLPGDAR
jgi:hypothetical protein